MMFNLVRLLFSGIVGVLIFLILKKKSNLSKPLKIAISIFVGFVVSMVSGYVPVENAFVHFESPEAVFYYTNTGTIEHVVCGEESGMVYYSQGGTHSRMFTKKGENGYQILNAFEEQTVAHVSDARGSISVYTVAGTEDYYVSGITQLLEGEQITDSNNKPIFAIVEEEINGTTRTAFVCDLAENYGEGYYLMVNGERIDLS